jgi:hypothetical protein
VRRAPSDDEEEADGDSEEEEEAEEQQAPVPRARGFRGGRPTRRARRRVNYAELSNGLASDDEEGGEGSEEAGGEAGEAPSPKARRGERKRRRSGDSDDEEFKLPEEADEEYARWVKAATSCPYELSMMLEQCNMLCGTPAEPQLYAGSPAACEPPAPGSLQHGV